MPRPRLDLVGPIDAEVRDALERIQTVLTAAGRARADEVEQLLDQVHTLNLALERERDQSRNASYVAGRIEAEGYRRGLAEGAAVAAADAAAAAGRNAAAMATELDALREQVRALQDAANAPAQPYCPSCGAACPGCTALPSSYDTLHAPVDVGDPAQVRAALRGLQPEPRDARRPRRLTPARPPRIFAEDGGWGT